VIFSLENSEQRLVHELHDGSRNAMQNFYALYAEKLTAVAARYISNDEDLKDVMQEVMVGIFTNIHKFDYRGKGSLLAWTSRVTANKALTFLRQQKHFDFVKLTWDIVEEAGGSDPEMKDISPEVLHECIRNLPPGYRAVLNLYVFENHTHEEIAQMLGIKRDTSASQLHRARKLLAKELKEYTTSKHSQR